MYQAIVMLDENPYIILNHIFISYFVELFTQECTLVPWFDMQDDMRDIVL